MNMTLEDKKPCLVQVLDTICEALEADGHSIDSVTEALMTVSLAREAKQHSPIAIARHLMSLSENFLSAARAAKAKEYLN
jgi:hypothetical protein